MTKHSKWTKWDEFKFNLKENYKAVLVVIAAFVVFLVIFDPVVSDGYTRATLLNEGHVQTRYRTNRVITAELDNGLQIILSGYSDQELNTGQKVKVKKMSGVIFGRTSYHFVEYIE